MSCNMQLSSPDYQKFVDYMCPGTLASGNYPPEGSNLNTCPKPILGTYGKCEECKVVYVMKSSVPCFCFCIQHVCCGVCSGVVD